MRRLLAWAVVLASFAAAASAQESLMGKRSAASRRSSASAPHSTTRASAPYTVHSAVGAGASAAPAYAPQGGGSGAGPSTTRYAQPIASFKNGRPLSTSRAQGIGSTPRALRAAAPAPSAASASIGGQGHAYTASQPTVPATAPSGPMRAISMEGRSPTPASAGVTHAEPDAAQGGGSAKDPMGKILDGLANMFKNMASMLGG